MTTLPKTKKKLSKKQKDFADAYLETGNGVQSALKAYDTTSPNTAGAIASENLQKPNVKAYLESKATRAAEIIFDLAQTSEVDSVRLNASKDILDRSGFKAFEQETQSVTINTYTMLFNAETQASIAEIDARIKARLTQDHDIQTS